MFNIPENLDYCKWYDKNLNEKINSIFMFIFIYSIGKFAYATYKYININNYEYCNSENI